MKMSKKIVAVLMALAMLFSLAACAGGDNYTKDNTKYEIKRDGRERSQREGEVTGWGVVEGIGIYRFNV